MGFVTIFRSFGFALIVLSAAMLIPLLISFSIGDGNAGDFLFSFAITLSAGVALMITSGDRRSETDLRGALLFVLLWWLVAPMFAGLPFILGGAGFTDSYFEAVSAVTTTGAWLTHAGAVESPSGMIWRALLQWIGGLFSLAVAAAIFIRPVFVGIDTLLPPFSRGERSSYLFSIRNAMRAFSGIYLLITFVCFVGLLLADAPLLDSGVMALSIVASGGFVPHAEGLGGYQPVVSGFLLPFIFLSGVNFVLIARVLAGTKKGFGDVESGAYALAIFFVAILFWLVAGAGDIDLIPAQFFNAASLLSTNGVTIGEQPRLAVGLVTVIIGGAAVSTAGGFKILRWLVIIRRAREETRRLVMPSAVFGETRISNELGVWMHFLVFTFVLGMLVLVVTAGGHSFQLAAAAAVGILANAGPVIALAEGGASYDVFDGWVKFALIAGMVLGRLEAVAALALFNRAFWRS